MSEIDFFENPVNESVKSEKKFESGDMYKTKADFFDDPKLAESPKSKAQAEAEIKAADTSEIPASEAPAVTKAQEKKIKELIAKFGDQDLKIPADAKIKHKSGGEEYEISIQELLNESSGKRDLSKKYTDLDKEKKAYSQQLSTINKYMSKFAELSKSDPVEALQFLAEEIGINPLEYSRSLRSQLINKYGNYLQMDETSRSIYDKDEELTYLRRQRETDISRKAEQQTRMELESKFRNIQQSHGINDNRLDHLANELHAHYKVPVTPENLVELHNSHLRLDRVENILKIVNPELVSNDEVVLELESLLRGNPRMSDKDLQNRAQKLFGSNTQKAVDSLSQRIPQAPINRGKSSLNIKPRVYSNTIDFFE